MWRLSDPTQANPSSTTLVSHFYFLPVTRSPVWIPCSIPSLTNAVKFFYSLPPSSLHAGIQCSFGLLRSYTCCDNCCESIHERVLSCPENSVLLQIPTISDSYNLFCYHFCHILWALGQELCYRCIYWQSAPKDLLTSVLCPVVFPWWSTLTVKKNGLLWV